MLYTIVAVLVLVLDQAVKFWTVKNIAPLATGGATVSLIPGVLHMTNVQNTGAAFAILANQRWLLVAVSALFIIAIIVLMSMDIIHTKFGRWTAVLVMAGALGNCIDRVMYGYVVDMFEIELFSFAVFNVADIFITVCGILFCIHVIVYREPAEERDAVPREDRGRLRQMMDDGEDRKARRREERRGGREERRSKAERPDPYANVPRRGTHRSLEDELRIQDPNDPFAEWNPGGREPAPAPRAQAAPASRPAPRTQAAPAAQPRQQSASARRQVPVDNGWDDYEPGGDSLPRSSGAAAPAQKRKAPDAGLDDYSLEDILSEFRDI